MCLELLYKVLGGFEEFRLNEIANDAWYYTWTKMRFFLHWGLMQKSMDNRDEILEA